MKLKPNKNQIPNFFVALGVFALVASTMVAPQSASGATGTKLYITPANQTVDSGANLVVPIIIDTGGASVNTVQTVVTYSASNFSFVSIAPGSAFKAAFPNTSRKGSVQFSAGSTNGVSGIQTVATLTLHVIGGGSSAINPAAVCSPGNYAATCSAAYDSATSNNDLSKVSGGTYTVNGTAAKGVGPESSKPGSASSSSNTGPAGISGSTGLSNATINQAAVPVISQFRVSKITPESVKVSWRTNLPATSIVQFGLTNKYGQTAQSEGLSTSHEVIIQVPVFSKGTTYYVKALSAAANGASATSAGQKFTTKGFVVSLQVRDSTGQVIKGAKVAFGSDAQTTDSGGKVTLQDVPAGPQKITVKVGSSTTVRTITVGKLNPAIGAYEAQKFSLVAARGSEPSPKTPAVVVGAVTVVLLAFYLILRKLLGGGKNDYTGGGSAVLDTVPSMVNPMPDTNPPSPNGPLPSQIITPDTPSIVEKI